MLIKAGEINHLMSLANSVKDSEVRMGKKIKNAKNEI